MKICHVLIASFLLLFVLGLVSGEQSGLEKKFLKSRVRTPIEEDLDNEDEMLPEKDDEDEEDEDEDILPEKEDEDEDEDDED